MRKTLVLSIVINKRADFSVIILVPDVENITGYTFVGEIKKSTDQEEPDATFDIEPLDQDLFPGRASWKLSAEDADELFTSDSTTVNLCRQTTPYIYDILMTDSLGEKTRIIQGNCYASPAVAGGV